MRFFLPLLLLLSGCASIGVPLSYCDLSEPAQCAAQYQVERSVNQQLVTLVDSSVCMTVLLRCEGQAPTCTTESYCDTQGPTPELARRAPLTIEMP